jgi:hypothetical protein
MFRRQTSRPNPLSPFPGKERDTITLRFSFLFKEGVTG